MRVSSLNLTSNFPIYMSICLMFHCSVSLEGSDTVLYLQPGDKKVIKAAGEDTSWFVSCRGDTGDKLLWSHLTSGMDTWDTSGHLDI